MFGEQISGFPKQDLMMIEKVYETEERALLPHRTLRLASPKIKIKSMTGLFPVAFTKHRLANLHVREVPIELPQLKPYGINSAGISTSKAVYSR